MVREPSRASPESMIGRLPLLGRRSPPHGAQQDTQVVADYGAAAIVCLAAQPYSWNSSRK